MKQSIKLFCTTFLFQEKAILGRLYDGKGRQYLPDWQFLKSLSPIFFMVLGMCLSLSRHQRHLFNVISCNKIDMPGN